MIKRAAAVSLAVLVLPVVELALFRFWLHYGLELRLGLPGFVDYDVILPSLFAFTLFMFLLSTEEPIEPEMQLPNLNLNLLFAFAFGAFSYSYHAAEAALGTMATAGIWTALLAGMIISGLSVMVPFSYVLNNPRRWVAFPCLFIASTVVLVKHVYTAVWPWFGVASAEAVCSVLQTIDGATKCGWSSEYYFSIKHPAMKILFGPPCSGTDSLMIFLVGFSLFLAMERLPISRTKTLCVFFVGVAYALFLNVARVVSIFFLSIAAGNYFDSKKLGLTIFVQFFHLHAGWVLYAIGWSFFFMTLHQMREVFILQVGVRRPLFPEDGRQSI